MEQTGESIQTIQRQAASHGLRLRGGFRIEVADAIPALDTGEPAGLLLLFGQAGSNIWPYFSDSPEYLDGQPHPLDRWSQRIGRAMAATVGGRALFPFDGPPWHPFGRWAQRAEPMQASPLGILMHGDYGLWHAYRFAIALPASSELLDLLVKPEGTATHACDHCTSKPCLHSCPVNAFSDGGYDVAACTIYLQDNDSADCHRLGCLARGACPEAPHWRYEPAHAQFHIKQFVELFAPGEG